jgi:hypothetical protein
MSDRFNRSSEYTENTDINVTPFSSLLTLIAVVTLLREHRSYQQPSTRTRRKLFDSFKTSHPSVSALEGDMRENKTVQFSVTAHVQLGDHELVSGD